jgi:STE24 endopeptidase
MAKANGIPADKIFVYNGSKQSNAYTANVSGLFGSARVAMSDTMFKQGADLAEVRGVVGHEMGHYAHHHALWIAGVMSLLAIVAFFLVDRLFAPSRPDGRRHGQGPGRSGRPAGAGVILAVLSLLGTPLTNSLIRIAESDADRYSLEHVNEPDGLRRHARRPRPWSRPSSTAPPRRAGFGGDDPCAVLRPPGRGRNSRVRRAMDWKAAHPLHGNIGHKQVEELLVRLYARHLTVDDIFEAAMKKPDALKPVKTGHGSDYTTPGRPFYYTADHGDA